MNETFLFNLYWRNYDVSEGAAVAKWWYEVLFNKFRKYFLIILSWNCRLAILKIKNDIVYGKR